MSRRSEDWLEEFEHITRVFPKRLEEMMNGMTYSQLSILSGVSLGTLVNWKNARSVPDLRCLFAVATILDASIDYLIDLDKESTADLQSVLSDTQPILSDTQSTASDTQSTDDDRE